MRRSAVFLLGVASLVAGLVSGQSSLATVPTVCTPAITCPSSAADSVPPAWLNLTFSTQPSTAATPNYGWEAQDAGDAQCSFQHSGIATFNASLTQYIDLNQASASSPLFGGAALPGWLGGASAGSLTAGTAGWSIEVTYRSHPESGNAKLFSIGAGQPNNNIFAGADGGGSNYNFGIYDGNTNGGVSYSDGHAGIIQTAGPFVPYQWYHMVFVMQQVVPLSSQMTDSGSSSTNGNGTHGAWWLYVNGQLLSYPNGVSQDNFNPEQVYRQLSYLAKSSWNDPAWSGLIDTFRIYNYALTQSQAVTLYNGEMGGCAVPVSTAAPANTFPNLLPRTTTGSVSPFYSLTFSSNPAVNGNGGNGTGYGWQQSLFTDSAANQQIHQGLLVLSGGLNQFVNMSSASGTNSVGQVLPTIGGGTAGWAFEIMFLSTTGADSWPKLIDIGSTRSGGVGSNPVNDIILGWDGNAGAPDRFWQFDLADNSTNADHEFQTGDAIGEVPYNTWTHVVAVITAPMSNGNANYLIYVNGALYTTVTNVWYPVAAQRQNAFLGKSGWNDPYFSGAVDFFNIYNTQLSDVQVAALYTAATTPSGAGSSTGSFNMAASSSSTASNTVTNPTSSASPSSSSSSSAPRSASSSRSSSSSSSASPSPSPSSSSAGGVVFPATSATSAGSSSTGVASGGGSSSNSSSGLSGGAIAGIVIGGVVGLLLLLAVCFFLVCAGGRRKTNKGAENAGRYNGGYGAQSDNSHASETPAESEIEMETH